MGRTMTITGGGQGSGFSRLINKIKSLFKRPSKEIQNALALEKQRTERKQQQELQKAVKAFNTERVFYRNPGLNRAERRRLAARLTKEKTPPKEKALNKLLLQTTPINRPYERWMERLIPDFAAKAKQGIIKG